MRHQTSQKARCQSQDLGAGSPTKRIELRGRIPALPKLLVDIEGLRRLPKDLVGDGIPGNVFGEMEADPTLSWPGFRIPFLLAWRNGRGSNTVIGQSSVPGHSRRDGRGSDTPTCELGEKKCTLHSRATPS